MRFQDFPARVFRVGSMSVARIEAFSDGVFAIVVTLLVLEIHVPRLTGPNMSHDLIVSLAAMMPKFLSYVLSFMIICIWWVAHHHLFHLFRRTDRGLLWFNCIFLLWLAFVPFPTAMLGDYPHERVAVMCYAGVMALAGVSFTWMRFYGFYVAHLTRDGLDRNLMRRAMVKSGLNPVLHVCALFLALLSTKISIALLVAIPLMFFLPSRLEKASID